jgi:hypothetical protein
LPPSSRKKRPGLDEKPGAALARIPHELDKVRDPP